MPHQHRPLLALTLLLCIGMAGCTAAPPAPTSNATGEQPAPDDSLPADVVAPAAPLAPLAPYPGEGGFTAAAFASKPPTGFTITRQMTDWAEALAIPAAPRIEAGIVDVSHVITDGPAYTVYEYDSELSAKAAMHIWRVGIIGEGPLGWEETVRDPPNYLGDDAAMSTFDDPKTVRMVARAGARVIHVVGEDGVAVGKVAGELYTRLIGVGVE